MGAAEALMLLTRSAALACRGERMPSGLMVAPCVTCARQMDAPEYVARRVMKPLVLFLAAENRVGWVCQNYVRPPDWATRTD